MTTSTFIWNALPALIAFAFIGWVMWRWLKASDEPLVLIVRWLITCLVLGFVLVTAARARDEFSKIVALLVGAVGGVLMTLVWRQQFCDFVGDQFASLYNGGNQEVDPTPFYSVAEARRKRGRFEEALAEVRTQLDRFPTDFRGWMLLAEIQAEDLHDLAAARDTLAELLAQPGHAPKNIAFALTREADWHLKFNHDREGARAALERIVELLPDTEQAQLALQRIAHLTPETMLEQRQEPRLMAIQHRHENIGLRDQSPDIRPAEEDPATAAGRLVQHLEEFPCDNDAREKLALIYAKHYQRLDLATDQLEQLIAFPKQPAKQVAHWLNLLADLQVAASEDVVVARQALQRIVDLYPKSAAAEQAINRMAYLKLELRPRQQNQAVKLGSYEDNLGLKRGAPGPHSAG